MASGVLQTPVLEFLFVIYINDLGENLDGLISKLYEKMGSCGQ